MVKFWKMLIAMLAMMAMVVVPTSCGDDDDDDEKNGKNNGNLLAGKIFKEEGDTDYFRFNADGTYDYYWWSEDEQYPETYEEHGTYKMVENNPSNFVLTYKDHDGDIENEVYQILKVDGKYYIGEVGDDLDYVQVNTSFDDILKEYKVWKDKEDAYEDKAEEKVIEQVFEEIQVVEGGVYTAKNEALGLAFTFRVTKVSGYYADKSQVVDLLVECQGKSYKIELSDAGYSYLMWTWDNGPVAVKTATAREYPTNIVMVLACANSMANYTITSATINDTMNSLGATETVFSKAK